MDADLRMTLAGDDAVLLGERALWLPQYHAVLLADLHLGKADVFRRAGIALPSGGTRGDLDRLQALCDRSACTQLWILGDVLHGPLQRAAWHGQWMAWRSAHPGLQVHVVRGNHDRALAAAALDVIVHEDYALMGPFRLQHEPAQVPGQHIVAGHLHPLAALRGVPRRWPAFWLREGLTVLPAFSGFTAGVVAALDDGDRLIACVEGSAIAVR